MNDSNLPEGVAIIGMSGRFPGARNVDEFWRILAEGRDVVSRFSPDELEFSVATPEALAKGQRFVAARSILDDVDQFDAAFFGIYPKEAELMDPQHRLFLECAWEALESAGYDPESYPGLIGVYAGLSLNTYLLFNIGKGRELAGNYQVGAYQLMLGNDKDFLPTRVSYKLNLRGPSMTVQTACSTSLVAVCQACTSLLTYQSDMALAGAASISFPQKRDYLYQEDAMVSADGTCRAFDAGAHGTIFGHGVAVVLLKRLSDALADRDPILGIIRGSAVNNDGSAKVGFAAPSVDAQSDVIALAQAAAGVHPEAVSYIEAHGTGTPLGDPIEVAALTRAFQQGGATRKGYCALGTGKTNIGHLDTAAGATGLIKVLLQFRHEQIPSLLHFQSPNPRIDFANSPFFPVAEPVEWKRGDKPRLAGVSAFGVGGTNAHIVVEEPPVIAPTPATHPQYLIVLSTKTPTALDAMTDNLAAHLERNPEVSLADVAFTLQQGRRAFVHRRAVVAADRAELIECLRARRGPRIVSGGEGRPLERLVFAFPGQGSQQPGIGADLYQESLAFREAMDECLAVADARLDIDLRELTVNVESRERATHLLEKTCYTQPALFATGFALARHFLSLHVRPDVMIGHSVGEFVAAAIAGIMAPDEGMRLIIERGRLMQDMPPGGMVALSLPEREALMIGAEHELQIAAINAPDLTVLSGQIDRIEAVERLCRDRGIDCKRLRTSHAFHSSMMDPAVEAFGAAVARLKLKPPSIPIISTATGEMLTHEQATSPAYWQSHLRVPVRFAAALRTLLAQGRSGVIELGPRGTLTSLAQRQVTDEHVFVASLGLPGMSEPQSAMVALASLWVKGAAIPWMDMFDGEKRFRVSLPTYPFERQRHWVEPAGRGDVPSLPAPLSANPISLNRESATQPAREVVEGVAGPAEVIQWLSTPGQSPLEALIAEQLVLMARQLELLGQHRLA